MATRFYFPSSTAATPISPTADAGWTSSASMVRRRAVISRTSTAMSSVTVTETATNPEKMAHGQYIYGPLAAQTLTGSIKGQFRCLESVSTLNANLQIGVRVIASDGTTVRTGGLSVTGSTNTGATPPEITSAALTNRRLLTSGDATPLTLTDVAVQEGDYLVIEIGHRNASGGTSATASISFGDNSATDLAENDTATTADNPWVEFSNTVFVERVRQPYSVPRLTSLKQAITAAILAVSVGSPLTLLTTVPAAPPITTFDYTNPVGAQFAARNQRYYAAIFDGTAGTPLGILINAGSQAIQPFDWPNPAPRNVFKATIDQYNLTGSTLTTVLINQDVSALLLNGNTPFFIPRGYPPLRPPQMFRLLQPGTPTTPPFINGDWPNPRGKPPIPDQWSFLGTPDLQLQSKDTFFGGAGKPPSFEPPENPRGYPFPIDLRTSTTDLIRTTLAPVVVLPFSQSDWPNPNGYVYPPSLRQILDYYTIDVFDQTPFYNSDWPAPRGAAYPMALRTFTQNVNLELLSQDVFFGGAGKAPNYDQPNPRGYAYSVALRTFLNGTPLLLIGADRLPFGQTEWPNPRGKFFSYDNRTFLETMTLVLIGKDGFFGVGGPVYDYPNPRGYRYPSSNLTFTNGTPLLLIGADRLPFGLTEWPNPTLKPWTPEFRSWLQSVSTSLNTTGAFLCNAANRSDFPNPRGYFFTIQLRGQTVGYVNPNAPTFKAEWAVNINQYVSPQDPDEAP